ncbi:hypothetical protein A2245_03560 [candidate division WWE3 bacterium RIFOXYA2_FULL_43_12]|nr:MAG: hypothetical protein A2245_03560 [candidate division WWE3 bacterium RIFOXYA2_FULL_43_12]
MINGANTTITTYRLVDASNVTSFSASATITGAPAYIEALDAQLTAVLGEQPGIESFDCYVEPDNYRVGDKVVDNSSVEYRISGIERHENNEDTDDVYRLRLTKQAVFYND